MNFTKDIYLNTDKLYENSSLIILYNGMLSKNQDNKVFLHYGYNDTWDNTDELKLKRTDSGMLGVLRVSSGNSFQFVFRDNNNGWDNNNNSNYILPILEKEDTVLEFGPEDAKEESKKAESLHSENLDLESSVYSSDEFEFEDSYDLESSSIPHNTIVNKFEFDDFTNTYYIKQHVINRPKVEEYKTLDDSFLEFTSTDKVEEPKVQETKITASTPVVDFAEDIAKEENKGTSLVAVKEAKPSRRSSWYILKRRIKLAVLKFVKLVKTALEYNTENNK